MMSSKQPQHMALPEATAQTLMTQLAYLEGFDELSRETYAFLAYREEKLSQKRWFIKIKANQTAGSIIDPEDLIVRHLISEAAQAGKDYALIGINLAPTAIDCRRIENRLYFDETLTPVRVEMHLQLRRSDGSPTETQVAEFAWPQDTELFATVRKPLLIPPAATTRLRITPLGYMNAYDVIADRDYAILAYREEQTQTGKWQIRIRGTETPGTILDPDNPAMKRSIMEAAERGETYILFGFHLASRNDDPRSFEIRISFTPEFRILRVAVHLTVRNADHSAKEPQMLSFDWPGNAETPSVNSASDGND